MPRGLGGWRSVGNRSLEEACPRGWVDATGSKFSRRKARPRQKRAQKKSLSFYDEKLRLGELKKPAITYFRAGGHYHRLWKLNYRVRNGNGCILPDILTGATCRTGRPQTSWGMSAGILDSSQHRQKLVDKRQGEHARTRSKTIWLWSVAGCSQLRGQLRDSPLDRLRFGRRTRSTWSSNRPLVPVS